MGKDSLISTLLIANSYTAELRTVVQIS